MDPYQIAALIVSLLFGTQGVASFIKARRSKRNGALPADEQEARQAAPAVEWLTDYYKGEIENLRGDLRKELADLKKQITAMAADRADDAAHIDALEEHIWLRKPPPPPPRRKQGHQ